MTDTNKLKELAERATPGPWSCNRHWAIVGGPTIEFTNGAAQQQIAMACWQSWMHEEELRNNAEFIAANNPKTVLALLDEIDRLKAENEALRKFSAEAYQVLGALDAPENVLDNASDAANGVPLRHETLLPFFAEDYEALRKDAARYRWLRDLPEDSPHEQIGNFPGWMWDEAIDKGIAEIQVTQPGATSSP
ncbi:ead/Ea22-like family protein [Pseudomonas aeruginosa]|nr:ead/Ea22-like family protein [Pseudomonas aeruginosa]